jgi:DNA-binding NarL/FixJ family response regulator
MNTIRVLLFDMPLMLRQIVSEIIAAEPDLETVGELEDMRLVATRQPDVVIVGLGVDEPVFEARVPDVVRALLDDLPRTKVLGLSQDGRTGHLYELRLQKAPIGEVSPARLITVIRKAVRGQ